MKSVWSESCEIKKREPLCGDISTEVLVVGAGMSGILVGYLLKESGKDVVIIDGNHIAGGNTKNTTAKITSQHGLIYDKLICEFDIKKAAQYAKANELAIKKYKSIIEENSIQCEFEEKPAYVYSTEGTEKIKKEVEAAKSLGIDAELVSKVNIPLDVKIAMKFNNQAQFNPLKFIKAISQDLKIYEETRALDIDNNVVITNRGKISAKYIVIATHYPIINAPGYYFMKMHQERSYVIALENAGNVEGMYIDKNKGGYSFRNYKDLLLFGGISERTGDNEEGGSYEKLREAAKKLYPKAKEKYHWSAQDCMTIDGIPYIGRYSSSTPNIYVTTGYNKW